MNIPTWDESINVDNPLAKFIYCNEPAGNEDANDFRERLSEALDYVVRQEQARLTATENALAAAIDLLSMSTAENNYLSAFSTCDICNAPTWSVHEETCEYRIAKERYHAACAALEKVTK